MSISVTGDITITGNVNIEKNSDETYSGYLINSELGTLANLSSAVSNIAATYDTMQRYILSGKACSETYLTGGVNNSSSCIRYSDGAYLPQTASNTPNHNLWVDSGTYTETYPGTLKPTTLQQYEYSVLMTAEEYRDYVVGLKKTEDQFIVKKQEEYKDLTHQLYIKDTEELDWAKIEYIVYDENATNNLFHMAKALLKAREVGFKESIRK
jgi:hypothetical protein